MKTFCFPMKRKCWPTCGSLLDWGNRAYGLLYADNRCINDQLKEVLTQIKEIRKIDPGLNLQPADVEGSYVVLQEAALALRDYTKKLVSDPERQASIDERLDAINRLKRKHGGTMDTLLARKREMEEELKGVSGVAEELENLTKEKEIVAADLREKALALSTLRWRAAGLLKKRSMRKYTA